MNPQGADGFKACSGVEILIFDSHNTPTISLLLLMFAPVVTSAFGASAFYLSGWEGNSK